MRASLTSLLSGLLRLLPLADRLVAGALELRVGLFLPGRGFRVQLSRTAQRVTAFDQRSSPFDDFRVAERVTDGGVEHAQ